MSGTGSSMKQDGVSGTSQPAQRLLSLSLKDPNVREVLGAYLNNEWASQHAFDHLSVICPEFRTVAVQYCHTNHEYRVKIYTWIVNHLK